MTNGRAVRSEKLPCAPDRPRQGSGQRPQRYSRGIPRRLGDGQRGRQADEGDPCVQQIRQPPAQQHRGPRQQHSAAAAEAVYTVLQRGKLQIVRRLARLQHGFIGDGLPRAGLQVIPQGGNSQGQAYPGHPLGGRHQQRGEHEHHMAGRQGPLPPQHVRQQAGGQLAAQAHDMEHRLRQADLDQREPPQGQQQDPHASRRAEPHRPFQDQKGPFLSGNRKLFIIFGHKNSAILSFSA